MTLVSALLLRRLRGVSLGEAAIGLVVLGMVASLAFASGQRVLESRRQQTALEQIYTIAQKVRELYLGQTPAVQDATTGTAAIVSASGFPLDMVRAGVVANDWGGAVTVSTSATDFTVTYSGLRAEGCIALATRIANPGQAAQMGLLGVAMSGNAEIAASAFPITPAQAGGAGGCGSSGAANAVAWRFAVRI